MKNFANKNITNAKVLNAIGELINQKQKDFLRKNLKEELIKYLDFFLNLKLFLYTPLHFLTSQPKTSNQI